MDFKRWNHLVVLAEERNFRRAAERVHLSQPAFSRSIQAAEDELGMQLFERSGAKVSPTQAGSFVIERARRMVVEHRQLQRDLALYRDREIGDLAFGMGPFAANALLPPLLDDLRQNFPRVQVRAHVNSARYLFDFVRREEHDFLVADMRFTDKAADLVVRPLGHMASGLYVRAGHPLAGRQGVSPAELVPFGLAMFWVPERLQQALRGWLGLQEGDALPIALECEDVHLLKRIALGSDVVMVGSPLFLQPGLDEGPIVALDIAGPRLPEAQLAVVSLRGRSPTPIATYAMELLLSRTASWRDEPAAA